MTLEEKQQVKALYVATSLYFGQQIPDAALKLYVDDLEDLPFDQVAEALKQVRRDPKTTRCPLPALVRARIEPAPDPESQAAIVASTILEAISSCGPYVTPIFDEITRRVVEMEGGWQQVCEMVSYDNLPTLRAQWRGLARGLIQERGMVHRDRLELEESGEMKQLMSLSPLLKEMPT